MAVSHPDRNGVALGVMLLTVLWGSLISVGLCFVGSCWSIGALCWRSARGL